TEMLVTVTLAGPAPWGFRITGGRDFGLQRSKIWVMERGKAAAGDLRPGDIIVSINGESAAELLHVEAQNRIKQSPGQLQLQVERVPSPSHANGDSSPERVAARFQVRPKRSLPALSSPQGCPQLPASLLPPQDTVRMREEGSWRPPSSSPVAPSPTSPSSQLLPTAPEELPRPGPPQVSRELCRGGPEPAMRRREEDSEVLKMLQENRELRAAPRQSSTFRLLQEALEEEGGAGPVAPFPSRLSPSARKPLPSTPKLHACEKCGSSIATQAVRIQEGRYRHPSCYACADCGLNLKMRGHFWVGDEMYCEKHARLRYQGPPGAPHASAPS
ncbi:PDLI2 protein, partial [Penelope pileata]|nr:PDLI2 protein [Penelope pileata]